MLRGPIKDTEIQDLADETGNIRIIASPDEDYVTVDEQGAGVTIVLSCDPTLEGDVFTTHFISKLRNEVEEHGGMKAVQRVIISFRIKRMHFVCLLSALQAQGLTVYEADMMPFPEIVMLGPETKREWLRALLAKLVRKYRADCEWQRLSAWGGWREQCRNELRWRQEFPMLDDHLKRIIDTE